MSAASDLEMYPVDTDWRTDKLLLDAVYDAARLGLSLDIPWPRVGARMEQHLGRPVAIWAIVARYYQLNFYYCMIRTLCECNAFQWDSERCETQASSIDWQIVIRKNPLFAKIKGFYFPLYEKLQKLDVFKQLHSDNDRDYSKEPFAAQQKRLQSAPVSHITQSAPELRPLRSTPASRSARTVALPKNHSSPECDVKPDITAKKRNGRDRRRSNEAQNTNHIENTFWTPEKDRVLIEQATFRFQTSSCSSSTWKAILKDWTGSFRIRTKSDTLYKRYHLLRNAYVVVSQLIKLPGFEWDDNSCTLTGSDEVDYRRLRNELPGRDKLPDALGWIFAQLERDSAFIFPLFKEMQNLCSLVSRPNKRRDSLAETHQERKLLRRLSGETDFRGHSSTWTEETESAMLLVLMASYQESIVKGDYSSVEWKRITDHLSTQFNVEFSENFLQQKFSSLQRKYKQWRKIKSLEEVVWNADECRIVAPDNVWNRLKEDKSHFQLYCLFRHSPFPLAENLDILLAPTFDESSLEKVPDQSIKVEPF